MLLLLIVTLAATVAIVPACRPRPAVSLEEARVFVDQFMCLRVSGRAEEAAAMLSAKGRAAFGGDGQPDLDLGQVDDTCGFLQVSELPGGDGKTFQFAYRIQQTGREAAYAAFWDETIVLLTEDKSLIVDGATMSSMTEASVDDALSVRLTREGTEIKLFDLDDLPDEFTPLGATPDISFGVGKEGYALLAFAPSGTRLAFVTWGVHGFLGTIPLSGGSKPEGVDLHWEGLTVDVDWSPDSQHIAAVIEQPTGNSALTVYRISPTQRLQLGLETMFAPDLYSIADPRWLDNNRLTIAVEHSEAAQDSKNGQWRVDINTKTIAR